MIARLRRWRHVLAEVAARPLRRWLLGPPCRLCALPVPPGSWEEHMAWHGAVALAMGRAMPPGPRPPRSDLLRPVRPAQPRPHWKNGGPA